MAATKYWQALAIAVVATAVLSGCTTKFLAADDRVRLCHVAVEERLDAFAFKPNASFDVAGGPVRGVAGGAGMALIGLVNPLFLPVSPMVLGLGMACGESARLHPHAQADFQRIVEDADRTTLKRTLVAGLNAGLTGCPTAGSPSPAASLDAIVWIEKVEVEMVCPVDPFAYIVTVKWRGLATPGERVLREATTYCRYRSTKDADDWVVDPGRARAEFERVLAMTGQQIAAAFLATEGLAGCWVDEGRDAPK